jgi:hypothetical protein
MPNQLAQEFALPAQFLQSQPDKAVKPVTANRLRRNNSLKKTPESSTTVCWKYFEAGE